ncbi:MAG: Ig-like domain-containing protein [Gemmatimonadales bacterium]
MSRRCLGAAHRRLKRPTHSAPRVERPSVFQVTGLLLLAPLAACRADAVPTGPDSFSSSAYAPSEPASNGNGGEAGSAGRDQSSSDEVNASSGRLVAIVLPDRIQIVEGQTHQLSASFQYDGGVTRPSQKVKWSSADPSVATVDADGLLTAWSAGTVEISVSALGKVGGIAVNISSSSVDVIQLNATSVELAPGESFQFWVDLFDRAGRRLVKKVNWSSSDPAVAEVDGKGLVTARAVGLAMITAKSGGSSATASVLVSDSPSDGGGSSGSDTGGGGGGSSNDPSGGDSASPLPDPSDVIDLSVSAADDRSATLRFTEVEDGTGSPSDYLVRFAVAPIDWAQASDVTKGSCSGSVAGSTIGGTLTCTVDGLQASTAYEFQVVSFRGTLGSDAVFGPLSNIAAVTTEDTPLQVHVTPSQAKLKKGENKKFDAAVTDEFGNPVTGQTVSWSSTKPTVASVDSSGMVSANSAGNVSIEASVAEVFDVAAVTVEDSTQTTDGSSGSDTGSGGSSGGGSSNGTDTGGATSSADSFYVSATDDATAILRAEWAPRTEPWVTLIARRVGGAHLAGSPVAGPAPTSPHEWTAPREQVPYHVFAALELWSSDPKQDGATFLGVDTLGVVTVVALSSTQSSPPSPSPAPSVPTGSLPAFPGAEGYGALALSGCRSLPLEVRVVTNLNDGGPGSLREAVMGSQGDRFSVVVFQTGGTIRLQSPIRMLHSCLYIAGQTAPGDGIQVRGPGVLFNTGLWGEADHLVMRYLRLRGGDNPTGDILGSNILLYSGEHFVVDHISTAWSNDENISIFPSCGRHKVANVTVQWTMITTGLWAHSTGLQVAGCDTGPWPEDVSIHHNALIHNSQRNPVIEGVFCIEVVNNVVYNWKARIGFIQNGACVDYVGNYWKKGPWTGNKYLLAVIDVAHGFTEDPSLYMRGNIGDPWQMDPNDDQTKFIQYHRDRSGPLPASAFVSSPQAAPVIPVTVQSAGSAYQQVLSKAGVSERLTCDGAWTSNRDALDQLFVSHVTTNAGPTAGDESDHENDYGGWPVLNQGVGCPDRDGDGMPDAFETRFALDPDVPADAAGDRDQDGYLNIEEYLNGTTP